MIGADELPGRSKICVTTGSEAVNWRDKWWYELGSEGGLGRGASNTRSVCGPRMNLENPYSSTSSTSRQLRLKRRSLLSVLVLASAASSSVGAVIASVLGGLLFGPLREDRGAQRWGKRLRERLRERLSARFMSAPNR